jgi:transcriptional regulator with XRE-family HTH domain
MEISYKLKKLRSEKHMTQQEVAEKLCVTRQAVSNWETGKTQPDFDMLRSIAEIYCVYSNTKISKKNLSKNKYYNN